MTESENEHTGARSADEDATRASAATDEAEADESQGETETESPDEAGERSTREMPFADNIHGLVDDILEGVRNFTPVASVRYPRYDFVETPGAYLLAFDVPGVERAGVGVTTEGEDLVVTGDRRSPDWGEGATVRRSERAFGGFRRTLRMPADVRVEEIRARLEDGILTVTLPRQGEQGGRKVDIEG